MILCVSMSMLGCGNTKENDKINSTENTESISKEVIETEQVESTENSEPTYTEYDTYFLQDGVEPSETTYDMNLLKPDGHTYTLTKSVNLYYTNEKLCGYTKEDIDIKVVTSDDNWSYVTFDKNSFLLKTSDINDAKYVEETEEATTKNTSTKKETSTKNNNASSETTKKETSSSKNESANTNNNTSNNNTSNTTKEEQPTNSEPKVEETQPQEQPTTSNKYTPEEAIAYYRSQVEAQGMQWNPSIKEFASWGSGWIPLSKDELNSSWIANEMAGFNYGSGDGTPFRNYYIEVTGSDEDNVYITAWVCE